MTRVRLAWLMLVATALVAATNAGAAGWVPRPGIEVSGAYGTVSRTFEGTDRDVLDRAYGGGWSAGATAEWRLAPSWTVVSGLRYLETGQSQTFTLASGTGTIRGDLHDRWRWVAVPMHARVTPWALPLSLEAGPEVQMLMIAKSHQELGGEPGLYAGATPPAIRLAPTGDIFEEVGTFGGDRDVTDLYQRVNFVLGGGVSYAWPARTGRVVAHARCGFGLNDLLKSDALASRTQTVEAGVGWQW